MYGDYGCDDMQHLLDTSAKEDTVQVDKDGTSYYLPLGRFDNRVDKTSFIREDEDKWSEDDKKALQDGMREAFDQKGRFAALLRRVPLLADVGVIAPRQVAERLPDLRVRRAPFDPEGLVVVLELHRAPASDARPGFGSGAAAGSGHGLPATTTRAGRSSRPLSW